MSTVKSTLTRLALAAALGASMLTAGVSAQAVPHDGPIIVQPPIGGGGGTVPRCQSALAPSTDLPFNTGLRDVGDRLHMQTIGTVKRSTGHVDSSVSLVNTDWFFGRTGTAMIVLRDNCNKVIGVTKPGKWGVDAFGVRSRTVTYNSTVDPRIAQRVASVSVLQKRHQGDRQMWDEYNAVRNQACANLMPLIGGYHCPV